MYDWDEAKRQSNLAAHGVDFQGAVRFDWDSDQVEMHVTKAVHHPIERIRGRSIQIKLPRAGFENIFQDTSFLFNDDPDTPWVKCMKRSITLCRVWISR